MPFLAGIPALLIIALFYWSRPPVLMLTDPSLTLLYGSSRARSKEAGISLRLFRPFISVQVANNASPEIVVEAVKAVHKAPMAVFFPYHFIEAARRFKDELPGITVIVMEGRQMVDQGDDFVVISTDSDTDFYRAGICAALLTRDSTGGIVFYQNTSFKDSHREAFEKGLEKGGFIKETFFLDSSTDYYSWQDISCVVISGPAVRFFERNLDIPVILFSWIDPSMTPANVKIIFDNSPWALAVESLRLLKSGGSTLPSPIILPLGRLGKSGTEIRKLIR